jgi:GTP pyrophosphokinase
MTGNWTHFSPIFGYFADDERARIRAAWDFMSELKKDVARSCGEPFMAIPSRRAHPSGASSRRRFRDRGPPPRHRRGARPLRRTASSRGSAGPSRGLVEGTSRISALKPSQQKRYSMPSRSGRCSSRLVDDVRVILGAPRGSARQDAQPQEFPSKESQRLIAQETIDIWAPLANRLGISSIRTSSRT